MDANDTNEDDRPPDGAEPDTGWVDDLGRRAGAAIRKPVPPDGLAELQQRRRQRQRITRASAAGAVVVLIAGTIGILHARSSSSSVDNISGPTATSPTTPLGLNTAASTTAVATTLPETTTTLSAAEQATQWAAGYIGGTPGAATGQPVKIGWVDDTGATNPTANVFDDGVNAAAGVLNAELGGFGGRPIQLVSCAITDAATATASANQMKNDPSILAVVAGPVGEQEFYTTIGTSKPMTIAYHPSPNVITSASGTPGYVLGTDGWSSLRQLAGAFLNIPAQRPSTIAIIAPGSTSFVGLLDLMLPDLKFLAVDAPAGATVQQIIDAIKATPGAADAPAMGVIAAAGTYAGNVHQALQTLGIHPTVASLDAIILDPTSIPLYQGDDMVNGLPDKWYAIRTESGPIGSTTPAAALLTYAAKTYLGHDVDHFAVRSFDDVLILAKLVNQLGGVEAATNQALRGAVAAFAGPSPDGVGSLNCEHLDPSGPVIKNTTAVCSSYGQLFQWAGGHWVTIADSTNGKLLGYNGIENAG